MSGNHPLRYAIDNGIIGARASSAFGDFYAIAIKDLENLTNVCLEVIEQYEHQNRHNSFCNVFREFEYVNNSLNTTEQQISIKRAFDLDNNHQIYIPTDVLIGADGYNSKIRNDSNVAVTELSNQVPYATFTYHPTRTAQWPHRNTVTPSHRRRFQCIN